MWPYLMVTGLVGLFALLFPGRNPGRIPWVLMFLVLLLFVGLRHHVGMDWNNYLIMIRRVSHVGILEAYSFAEPLYASLLWISGRLGFGVYGSNLSGTLIFMLGLFRYARTTPAPWISLMVAMPFLVIVVAMSANRQAVAIGVLLWLVASWDKASILRRATFIGVASLFHVSALVFLIFILADIRMNRIGKYLLGGGFLVGMFWILSTTGKAEYYNELYLAGQTEMTQSTGAIYHVLFNGGPAIVYLLMRLRNVNLLPNSLHHNMALLSVALVPATYFASVASGRLTLYLFPVAMYVFAAFMNSMGNNNQRFSYRVFLVVFLTATAAYWLGFSNSGHAHLPYQNLMTTDPVMWRLCC